MKPKNSAMITEDKVTEIFCIADDFCKVFDAQMAKYTFKAERKRKYHRESRMSKAEIMVIMILFHSSGYRCLKHFYLEKVCKHMRHLFPEVVSYNRWSSESRSQTCLDYAESWQRKTKSAPWVCLPPRGAPWRGKSVRTQAFRIHAFALAGRTSSPQSTQGDALGYALVAPPGCALNACYCCPFFNLVRLRLFSDSTCETWVINQWINVPVPLPPKLNRPIYAYQLLALSYSGIPVKELCYLCFWVNFQQIKFDFNCSWWSVCSTHLHSHFDCLSKLLANYQQI